MDERHPANGTVAPVLSTDVAPGRRNLRPPWKPGQSGNPRGRVSLKAKFEAAFHRAAWENADRIIEALISRALEGDAAMMRLVIDRMVRRPEHSLGDGEQAQATRLEIKFVNPDGAEG